MSADRTQIASFKTKLRQKIIKMNLTTEQVYNADETALFYKILPNRTYITAGEKSAPGLKVYKSHITFLACANASGQHKLNPLIIGRAVKPRCMRGWATNPVNYNHN